MTERRSAHERHYLLADGTYRAEVHQEPIHYQTADGSWQPIDTTLRATAKPGFAVSNETNALKAFFSASGAGSIRVEAGNTALTLQPLAMPGGTSTVQGSLVQFSNTDARTVVTYTVEPGKLKELITLAAPGPAPAFRYNLVTEGLTARNGAGNCVGFADASGQTVMTIPAPWMKDAAGKYGHVSVALTRSTAGLVYAMVPDPAWLAFATYPVTIDPTITLTWAVVDSLNSGQLASFWIPGSDDDSWPYPTPGNYLLVGAPEYSNGPYRSILHFNVTGLPLDSEIQSATLTLLADHATADANIQVQVYNINKTLDPAGSSDQYPTPNNIGVLAAALSQYPSVTVPLDPNFWGTYKTFDVSDLLRTWADDRTYPINLMLRDTQEDVEDWRLRSSAVVYFTPTGNTLNVTYTTPGWYMFQGNGRHTGRTQYDIPANAMAKWSSPAALPTPAGFETESGTLRRIPPAVVAVPGTNGSLATIYAVVSDGTDSSLYRLEDHGTSYVASPASGTPVGLEQRGQPHNGFVATGLMVAGGKVIVCGYNPLHATMPEGFSHVFAFDTTTLAQLWDRQFRGLIRGEPAYSPVQTAYTLDGNPETNSAGSVILDADLFRLEGGVTWVSKPYMVALSVENGHNVWGATSSSPPGDLDNTLPTMGGLPVFADWDTLEYKGISESSPVVNSHTAYSADGKGYINARDLRTGAFVWAAGTTGFSPTSSLSLFGKDLYLGSLDAPCVDSVIESPALTGTAGFHATGAPRIGGTEFAHIDSTVAQLAERHALIFGDYGSNPATGRVHSIGTNGVWNEQLQAYLQSDTWTTSYTVSSPVHSSVLVAGAPGTSAAHAFAGSDNGYVAVLDAVTAGFSPPSLRQIGNLGPLGGKVRASMGSYQGRLYVLATSETSTPTLYCFGN